MDDAIEKIKYALESNIAGMQILRRTFEHLGSLKKYQIFYLKILYRFGMIWRAQRYLLKQIARQYEKTD